MTTTECECPDPGPGRSFACPRHGCRKNRRWWELCRERPDYFRAWEEGRGPGQPRRHVTAATANIQRESAQPAGGPGTELKLLLRRMGIGEKVGCQCAARARVMDSEGPDWCESHLDVIVGWLAEEAGRRKLPFIRSLAGLLVRRAIRNARRKDAILRDQIRRGRERRGL